MKTNRPSRSLGTLVGQGLAIEVNGPFPSFASLSNGISVEVGN
ncbi:MAG: hypothetical protein ABIP94_08830 [Planctomycetota bacterium]